MIKFLFLDSWTLEEVRGFERRMGQPVKYAGNPIFRPERPYEYKRVHLYGTVLRDPESGRFKMWYSTHALKQSDAYLCYATSEDGVHWTRPDLDVVEGTNIVLDREEHTHGPSVLYDGDDPDASRRYKLLMRPGGVPAIFAYLSPDGIHWRKAQEAPVIEANSDCHIGLYRDPHTGLYQASHRLDCPDRRVWRTESEDFLHWRRSVLALEPDVGDPPQTQIYGMQMSPYGNFIMGWVSMFNTRVSDFGWSKMQGTMDVQLAHSRDGYCWHRTALGERFIPLGEEGSWEAQLVIPSTAPVLLDEEIRFYYSAAPYPHGGPSDTEEECIGMASLRIDGFVSLRAGEGMGELCTRPFALREPEIFVNADASEGEVKVEVCERSGGPIEGFGFGDCRPIHGNGVAQRGVWADGADSSRIVKRPIRLRVRARCADLYSIWMPNGDENPPYWRFREIGCLNPMRDLERA